MEVNGIKGFDISFRAFNNIKPSSFEHYHDAYELSFFLTAQINIFVQDMNYYLQGGDILFINEYDLHKVVYNVDIPYSRYVINFQKDFIYPHLKKLGAEQLLEHVCCKGYKKASLTISQQEEMIYLFNSLYKLSEKSDGKIFPIKKSTLVHSYIFLILSRFNELLKDNPQVPVYKKDVQVQEIIRHIDSRFSTDISLDSLQSTLSMSKFHISHIFKEVTGFSVCEYIQYRRIIEAQKMLKIQDSDILAVCFNCGFTNLQHFYKVFKKIAKVTPKQIQEDGFNLI